MHLSVWEHIVSLYYMVMKLGRDEVFIALHNVFRPYLPRGGYTVGQNVSRGLLFKNVILQTGRLQQQIKCMAMILKHVG